MQARYAIYYVSGEEESLVSTAHIRGQSGSCCVGSEVTLQNVTGCLYTLEVSYRHVSGDGSRRGVRPSELATWGSCILAVEYSVEYDAATLGKGHYKKQKRSDQYAESTKTWYAESTRTWRGLSIRGVQKLTCYASVRYNGQLLGAFASVIRHWELMYCDAHVLWGEYESKWIWSSFGEN